MRAHEARPLRLRLFTAAARLVTTGRDRVLRFAHHRLWAHDFTM
ncbi:hypothetical protein [Streptomyces sp. NPDC093097]